VTMKNVVFWGAMPCYCCKNRRFGGTHLLHHQGRKKYRARNNVRSNWAIRSFETSVVTRSTRRHIPEGGIRLSNINCCRFL
jgi:hypothetical protein